MKFKKEFLKALSVGEQPDAELVRELGQMGDGRVSIYEWIFRYKDRYYRTIVEQGIGYIDYREDKNLEVECDEVVPTEVVTIQYIPIKQLNHGKQSATTTTTTP